MGITKRITLEEHDDGGMPPPPPPPPEPSIDDGGEFSPPEHPWGYEAQAKVHIADRILTPDEDQMKEFTFMPQGIINEMILADGMVTMMDNYMVKGFNLAKYIVHTVDKRLRGLDGKMVKYAVLLAGDERKDEELNPNTGPMI